MDGNTPVQNTPVKRKGTIPLLILRLLLLLVGAALAIIGFIESRTLDGQVIELQVYIVLYGTAAVLLLGGIFLPQIARGFRRHIPIRILTLFVAAFILFLFVTAGIIVIAPSFIPLADGSEPIVLVLGAPVINDEPSSILISRADRAAGWVKAHPEQLIVISGGKGGTETEAQTIEGLMEDQGVIPYTLLLENEATTTEENCKLVKELMLEDEILSGARFAVLTNRFHIFRLQYLAKRQGYDNICFIPVSTPGSTALLWYTREVVLTIRYWFTGIS